MALSNNDVLKKIRVALKLKDTDIVEILSLVDFKITKSEINSFFRADDHPKYMELKDQILRNFLNGLIIYKRGPMPGPGEKPQPQANKPAPKKGDFQKKRPASKEGFPKKRS